MDGGTKAVIPIKEARKNCPRARQVSGKERGQEVEKTGSGVKTQGVCVPL